MSTDTYTQAQQDEDRALGRPVCACPKCGKRSNVALVRQFGTCLTCRTARG